jgi:hypothetical protein
VVVIRKELIVILSVILLLLVIIAIFFFYLEKRMGYGSVCFRNNCFYVEVPLTSDGMMQGLMFREKLDQDKGMLFIFEKEGAYPFWMKNTLIPLDIIWINENRSIVFISKNTQPCGTSTCHDIINAEKARYVLEINGGISDKLGMVVGDRATFDKSIEDILLGI